MKTYDAIGYFEEGDPYCEDCAVSEEDPIFADSEWDYPLYCAECGCLIPVILTLEGLDDVKDALLAHVLEGKGDHGVLASWWNEYGSSLDLTEEERERIEKVFE